MNRNSRRNSRQSGSSAANSMSIPAHVLIAVVAIIECLILISFTTYSWIESNSSLVIMNGRQSTTQLEDTIVNIDIDDALNYKLNLTNDGENADIDTFFRYTKNYRYGRASSADGVTFWFPKRNNTYPSAQGTNVFRKGDTTDYNTSYLYFDFIIDNDIGNRDFYFDDTDAGAQSVQKVFSVDDPSGYFNGKTYTDGGETKNKLDAVLNAMRISVTTSEINGGIESASDTVIYSVTGATYAAQNGVDDSNHQTLTSAKIKSLRDYGAHYNLSRENVQARTPLFTSKKNRQTKVSVRVWLEIMDPDFQKAFNFSRDSQNPNSFSEEDFAAIAGVTVNLDITFANTANSYVPFYFDDYTFDNSDATNSDGNRGRNMTLANTSNPNYAVWFHGWDPDTEGWVDYKMTRENSQNGRTRWSADSVPVRITDHLQNGITTSHLNDSYFIYGASATETAPSTGLKWNLYTNPTGGSEFVYSAYSRTFNGSTTYGVGAWTNAMTLVTFKDMATASVTDDFNNGTGNYRFMNTRAADDRTNYHVFVNNNDNGTNYDANFAADVTQTTAAMYYDSTGEVPVFKAYVPSQWLHGNGALYFNYSYNGVFSRLGTNVRWFARNSTPRNNDYIYTALGYEGNHTVDSATTSSVAYYGGVGTWTDVERINFSAELIDYDHAKEYRYFIGINGSYGQNTNTVVSYPMVPDDTNMLYSAYIPQGLGVTTTDITFYRHNSVNSGVDNTYVNPNVTWSGTARGTSSTYYPVDASTPLGYWHLSVLVDGTYENLIYDTLTDDDNMGNSTANTDADAGILMYSVNNGSSWSILYNQSGTDANRIDAYRWYVNCDPDTTVLYRWIPYYGSDKTYGTNDDTIFEFTHDTSLGLYCVVTEAESAYAPSGTAVQRLSSRRLRLEALVESGLADLADQLIDPTQPAEAPSIPDESAGTDTPEAPVDTYFEDTLPETE